MGERPKPAIACLSWCIIETTSQGVVHTETFRTDAFHYQRNSASFSLPFNVVRSGPAPAVRGDGCPVRLPRRMKHPKPLRSFPATVRLACTLPVSCGSLQASAYRETPVQFGVPCRLPAGAGGHSRKLSHVGLARRYEPGRTFSENRRYSVRVPDSHSSCSSSLCTRSTATLATSVPCTWRAIVVLGVAIAWPLVPLVRTGSVPTARLPLRVAAHDARLVRQRKRQTPSPFTREVGEKKKMDARWDGKSVGRECGWKLANEPGYAAHARFPFLTAVDDLDSVLDVSDDVCEIRAYVR